MVLKQGRGVGDQHRFCKVDGLTILQTLAQFLGTRFFHCALLGLQLWHWFSPGTSQAWNSEGTSAKFLLLVDFGRF